MRSSVTRWVVAGAVGFGLIGLAFKAADLVGPDEMRPSESPRDTAPRTPERLGAAGSEGERERAASASAGGADAPGAGAPEIAEPLDTVHALVPQPAKRARVGSAAAKNRRSAVAAGPRARRRSTPLAAHDESDRPRGLHEPAGSGAILPGENPGERAPAEPVPDVDDVIFDSGDVAYRTDAQVAVADLTGVRAGTVSFWLQPQWAEGNQDDADFIALGDNLQVVKNVNFIRFEALDGDKVTAGVGAPITEWKDGEWHQVTATWQGDQLALYLDGQLVSRQQRLPPVQLADNAQMLVGSSYPPGRPVAPAALGQVGLENRPLSPGEVQARFLKTLGQ